MQDQTTSTAADQTKIFCMPSLDATVPDLMASQQPSYPSLTVIKGPQTGATFVLDAPEVSIGRDPSNAVFLNDMTVSRHHALIKVAGSSATVEDLGSLNGTWVDGAIVNNANLSDGSTIQIGTFRMVFHSTNRAKKINTSE